MPEVHIVHHNPGAVFSTPVEVITVDDRDNVVRQVEPSGNVGTQFPKEIGSQWLGTVDKLSAGLATGRLSWADVYKTDVMWTTPPGGRAAADAFKNDFNRVYQPLLRPALHGSPLVSNRMARFTHPEGFPDVDALFEVQIKAIQGESVSIGGSGKIDHGYYCDYQPSGASTMHTNAAGETVAVAPGPRGAGRELEFIMAQFESKLRAEGVDCRSQCVWVEILVAVDGLGGSTGAWAAVEDAMRAMRAYFPDNCRPAGIVYPVSCIPNLDGIIEVSPRFVGGDVAIRRSVGKLSCGLSEWTCFTAGGVTEQMISAITSDGVDKAKTTAILDQISAHVAQAGGTSLKADGVYNNAYVLATEDSAASRARLSEFNTHFIGWYGHTARPGRTAQFMGGIMSSGQVRAGDSQHGQHAAPAGLAGLYA